MGNELRRKTAMVLHQIEDSLGSFVLNKGYMESLNVESLENIHKREVDKGRGFKRESIKDVVEATYLDELFSFAIDIANDNGSLSDSINYLYSLFHHLDIYEIRNAISHPNRPFWDCYWYRVASIASDPVNEILGFNDVKKALGSAEAGIIDDPPEEWLSKVIWQIPNNLPEQFDHGLTGLIGRSKELNELKKDIANPRINTIALVAPGGAGKTALALDLLDNIVSNPTYTKYIDCVIYATLKTEKLTSGGVISLDSIETINELKRSIADSLSQVYDESFVDFDETVDQLEDSKVLLCVDNLETLLRDDQNSFDDFNRQLPSRWKVLITSRVSITNSTILSLSYLKEKSAIHLARSYLAKRGGGDLLSEADYVGLTKSCFYNPLAIRLTIDLVVSGHDLPESLNVANKEIAEFSYNNLIKSLSSDAIEVLEAIFVEGTSTRLSLCELLEKDIDDISSIVGDLSRTSLISRRSSEKGESYSLSDSVRELLVISPRNIDSRNKVQERLHKRRVLSKEIDIKQEEKELPIWHVDYIPKETNENLKILATEVPKGLGKARRNPEVAISLFRRFKDAKYIYDGEYLYFKSFARILEVLKDYKTAEDYYLKAISLEPDNPSSRYLLARLYHATKRYAEAYETYEVLIDQGWISSDDENISFSRTIYNGYFLALLYSGKYEKVFELTKKWKEAGVFRGLLGTYRASAWKRKMENLVSDDPDATVDALIRAARILSDVFRNEGYFNAASKQAIKLYEEIEFCFSRKEYSDRYPEKGSELLAFVAGSLVDVSQAVPSFDPGELIKKLGRVDIASNPFYKKSWFSMSGGDLYQELIEKDARPSGLLAVVVSNRPKDKASFLFARDGFGQDYFLHFDNFKDGGWKDWCRLSIGMSLDIVADTASPVRSGKAIAATEVYYSTND